MELGFREAVVRDLQQRVEAVTTRWQPLSQYRQSWSVGIESTHGLNNCTRALA